MMMPSGVRSPIASMKRSVLAALASIVLVGFAATLASAAAANSNRPSIGFMSPSPDSGATLTTDAVTFAFEYNRQPKATDPESLPDEASSVATDASAGGQSPPAQTIAYRFTTFDVPFAGATFFAIGINNWGQVVGYYGDYGVNHGFLYDGNTLRTIDVPFPGAYSTRVFGINNRGQVVGYYYDGDRLPAPPTYHGFLDDGDQFSTIDVQGAFGKTGALGINDRGQIVGIYGAGAYTGFVDDRGVINPIEVPDARTMYASGINNRGQVVGIYYNYAGPSHGFLYERGEFSTIDVSGATGTTPYGINDRGQIVGDYHDGSGRHGFLYDKGEFTTIDVPFQGATSTSAYGINDRGQVVGNYEDASGRHGFIATP